MSAVTAPAPQRHAGKTVVITGGASGIGEATAHLFAAEGARVAILDVDAEAARRVADAIGARGAEARAYAVDISRWAEVERVAAEVVADQREVQILVNCAGVGAFGKVTDVAPDAWHRTLDITLGGVFHCSRAFIPAIAASGGGAVVNVGSTAGLAGDYGLPAYNAAKGAVVNLSRSMAIDHIAQNVRINCVCPGIVTTPASAKLRAMPEYWEDILRPYPSGRSAEPEEIGRVIAFLASDEASAMVGATVVVDGGLSAWTGQPAPPGHRNTQSAEGSA